MPQWSKCVGSRVTGRAGLRPRTHERHGVLWHTFGTLGTGERQQNAATYRNTDGLFLSRKLLRIAVIYCSDLVRLDS